MRKKNDQTKAATRRRARSGGSAPVVINEDHYESRAFADTIRENYCLSVSERNNLTRQFAAYREKAQNVRVSDPASITNNERKSK